LLRPDAQEHDNREEDNVANRSGRVAIVPLRALISRTLSCGRVHQFGARAICERTTHERRHPLEMIGNTAPFDISHHPAMTLPCGMVDGLPVGLMLVGKHWDEPTIYKAAYAFEQTGEWKQM
jgi:Asp-tRNA(Asn)/Glu-tRNA(Gln) amidotransferase A subunit family amidase